MRVSNQKRRVQVRAFVCLLFLCLFGMVQACGRDGTWGAQAEQREERTGLDVWFFACSEDADSILLQTEDTNILIDTGVEEDSGELVQKLESRQVDCVDLLILTHPDKDHIGGAAAVLENFAVEQVLQTSCDKDSRLQDDLERRLDGLSGCAVSVPDDRQQLDFGSLRLTVYPPKEKEYGSANNYSIAVLAEYEGRRFFFAGDAKKKRIGELLEEALPQVDVYKTAHHGRDSGNGDRLIEMLVPKIAVVTAKAAEKETQQALTGAGAEIYTTWGQDVHMTVINGVLDVR